MVRSTASSPSSEEKSVADLLREMPVARRESVIRSAHEEIINLLEAVHLSVGFPKADGRWSPALAHDLEAVRQRILNPRRLPPEVDGERHRSFASFQPVMVLVAPEDITQEGA